MKARKKWTRCNICLRHSDWYTCTSVCLLFYWCLCLFLISLLLLLFAVFFVLHWRKLNWITDYRVRLRPLVLAPSTCFYCLDPTRSLSATPSERNTSFPYPSSSRKEGACACRVSVSPPALFSPSPLFLLGCAPRLSLFRSLPLSFFAYQIFFFVILSV